MKGNKNLLDFEPKIDFVIESEPWSEKDAADFALLIADIKRKNKRRKISDAGTLSKIKSAADRKRLS